MMYDQKCYDLAEHFLPEIAADKDKHDLALHVQRAVDDWVEAKHFTESATALVEAHQTAGGK